jgi:hypothetical protein
VTEKEIDRIEASIEMLRHGIRMFRLPPESIHYLSRGSHCPRPPVALGWLIGRLQDGHAYGSKNQKIA